MSSYQSPNQGLANQNYSSWLDFHESLSEMRNTAGLTQLEVANKLGISQSAVSQFESLSRLLNLQTVFLNATVVGAKIGFSRSQSDCVVEENL